MRDDQTIRAIGIGCVAAVYIARTALIGNGAIPFLGLMISPFGLTLVAVVLMALPETIEMLPFGPVKG